MDIKEADVNVLEQEIKFNNEGFKLQAPFKLLVCGRSGAGKEIIYKLCVVASAWGNCKFLFEIFYFETGFLSQKIV